MGGGRTRAVAIGLLASCLVACSNHLRFVEFEEKEHHADVRNVRYAIQSAEPVVESKRLSFECFREEVVETRVEQTFTRVEEYTPYSALRELYEVPAGLVSIPLSVVFNVVGVVLPGYVSGDLVGRYTDWTFAAANPFLNAASSSRMERREVDSVTRTADAQENRIQTPLARLPMHARYDEASAVVFTTDTQGQVEFHVLQVPAQGLSAPPRKLRLGLQLTEHTNEDSPWVRRDLFVDRALSNRIREASPLLGAVKTDQVRSANLSEAVFRLDQLGFREYSLRLEDQIYKRFDANQAFLEKFRADLDEMVRTRGSRPAAPAQR